LLYGCDFLIADSRAGEGEKRLIHKNLRANDFLQQNRRKKRVFKGLTTGAGSHQLTFRAATGSVTTHKGSSG
jgi:hypothetical protein